MNTYIDKDLTARNLNWTLSINNYSFGSELSMDIS